MNRLISLYSPTYPKALVYMLQNTEYQIGPYLSWYRRVTDFRKVMYRRQLDKTKAASTLVASITVGIILQVVIGLLLIYIGITGPSLVLFLIGVVTALLYPFTWAYLVTVPIMFGKKFITDPRHKALIQRSKIVFEQHSAVKIAVAGSYGKTTMKELLRTVLSEGKHVAATPANKNVSSSHAQFAQKLTGEEEILIIEFGEGEPGDIQRFTEIVKPTLGVITGLAPAHLDKYPTLAAVGEDIFYLAGYVGKDNAFVNTESEAVRDFLKPQYLTYNHKNAVGWKISNVQVKVDGLRFEMNKGSKHLNLQSSLIGRHQVGPLAVVAAIADRLGLSKEMVERGIAKTEAFEHRMQARNIHGAWILDDTYNGNIEGMKAGLALLRELPAKRRVYVTPGLVDQGVEERRVHLELGKTIAGAGIDKVILMNNSALPYIKEGIEKEQFRGEIQIEEDPLAFYANIEHFLAAGDIMLLQNDWTDNYS